MNAKTIVMALEELDLGSDISGVSDGSGDDETYKPRESTYAESTSSEEEIQDVEEEIQNVEEVVGEAGDAPAAPGPAREPAEKRRRVSRLRVMNREWLQDDLPVQEVPASELQPRGLQEQRYDVSYFMKVFGESNIELLTVFWSRKWPF